MAFSPKICVTKNTDCESIIITDATGVYSASNPGGYGDVNPEIADFHFANIVIEKRNSDGTYTTSDLSPIDVYGDFPSSSDGTITITGEDAGYGSGSNFDDGIYRITYNLGTDVANEYAVSYYFSQTCAIDCCYQQVSLEASTCNCVCDDINNKLKNIAFYRRLLSAATCCANLNLIQKYIDMLTKICSDCNSCGSCC